ncbi:MAG: septum formation initiator family protein [Rhizobiales bacterium]|nr:septum formation initiator family protein [Hyphomicrobiales bacterium]
MIARKFDLVVLLACLTLLGYFGWHAFYGPRVFDRMERLKANAAELDFSHAKIVKQRERLDQRVGLMRPAAIDPDMVDELARSTLEFARKDELVIMTATDPKKP